MQPISNATWPAFWAQVTLRMHLPLGPFGCQTETPVPASTCGCQLSHEDTCQVSNKAGACSGLLYLQIDRASASEVHAAHSAHASAGPTRHRWALLLRQLRD